jgi:glutaredoxin 3
MEAWMADRTIIYGKDGCPYTRKARAAYKDHDYFDVKLDPGKLTEMLALSNGQRKVPVIVINGKVTIGYEGS